MGPKGAVLVEENQGLNQPSQSNQLPSSGIPGSAAPLSSMPMPRQVPIRWGGKPIGAVTVEDNPKWSNLPKNIPGDFVDYASQMGSALIHPQQTAEALGGMAAGGVEKLIPGQQPNEWQWNAFTKMLSDKYGSLENAKRQLITHPVETTADISSFLLPLGKLVEGAGWATKLGRMADIGETITKIGAGTEPMAATWKGISLPIRAALPSASRLYSSAAKIVSKLGVAEEKRLADVALANDIMPDIRGYIKADESQHMFAQKVTKLLGEYDKNNPVPVWNTRAGQTKAPIYLEDLFYGLDEMKKDSSLVGKGKVIDALEKRLKSENYGKIDPTNGKIVLQTSEVQKIKTMLNAENESYFAKMGSKTIGMKAKVQIAHNAKAFLEYLVPEIKGINAQQSDMIALRAAISKAAGRIRRRDISGLGMAAKIAAGGVAAEGAGVGLGLGLGLLDTPSIKARIARILFKLEQRGVKLSPRASAFRAALFQGGRQMNQFGGPNQYKQIIEKKMPIQRYEHLTDEDVKRILGGQ